MIDVIRLMRLELMRAQDRGKMEAEECERETSRRQAPSCWPMKTPQRSTRKNVTLIRALLISVCLINHFGTSEAINSVLDINGTFPYLIDRASGLVIEPRDYMDFENIYTPNDTYQMRQTAQGRNYHMLKAFDFANYFKSDYWHYSRRQDLLSSAQPVAHAVKCSEQLDWIESQLNRSHGAPLFYAGQQHVQLATLMDSYGHPESTTYFGHGYWLGSYHECRRVKINLAAYELEECLRAAGSSGDFGECRLRHGQTSASEQQPVKFRYCIGKAHDVDWPQDDNYVPRISYKIGLCLPETCETLTFESRPDQLGRLMRFNLPEHSRQRIKLHELYCLPDERSPVRRLSLPARVFLAACCLWLAVLTLATLAHSAHRRHQAHLRAIILENQRLFALEQLQQQQQRQQQQQLKTPPTATTTIELSSELATRQNLTNQQHNNKMLMINLLEPKKSLPASGVNLSASRSSMTEHSSDSGSSRSSGWSVGSVSAWLAESPGLVRLLGALSIRETLLEFKQPPRALSKSQAAVNLNVLDSIKCLCCVLVIFGHIVFIHMQHLSNIVHTIELSNEISPRFLIALFNFVDTFFIISGMLTSYFIFKRFTKRTFANPLVWVYISLMRLLRLSPVYILVLWYIKTSSVYQGEGPLWDYGTDGGSIKGLCMNDNWWKSILYLGNWNTMQPTCILPAWSIIVDAQYSLITPLIIYLIFKHRRLGYLLLLAATCFATTKMTLQLAHQTAVRTSDMAKIRLHVYPLISRFAAEFYNTAWNRLGPVAIGIVSGHALYLYETGSIKRWPVFMRGRSFKLVLGLHLMIFLLPVLGRFTDDPMSSAQTDTTIFILSNATIKPVWSIINSLLLLRLITDLRSRSLVARLMAHNIWHCLGKLCFTSYLIHYEIILTMLKSRDTLLDPNWSNAFREFSAVFLISTVISYIIYILYEAPMNKLITMAFSAQIDRLKRQADDGDGRARDGEQADECEQETSEASRSLSVGAKEVDFNLNDVDELDKTFKATRDK